MEPSQPLGQCRILANIASRESQTMVASSLCGNIPAESMGSARVEPPREDHLGGTAIVDCDCSELLRCIRDDVFPCQESPTSDLYKASQ